MAVALASRASAQANGNSYDPLSLVIGRSCPEASIDEDITVDDGGTMDSIKAEVEAFSIAIEGSSEPLDDVLDAIGLGCGQAVMMAWCGMGWFADAVEQVGLPLVFVDLDREWGTSVADWGVLNSATAVSSVAGALSFSTLADRYGRRTAFIASLALIAVAGVASAAAPGFKTLLLLRVATNLGAGGLLPVAASLLLEHLPPSRRDSCVALMQIFFATGALLAICVSWLLPRIPGSWRVFLLLVALPPALLAPLSTRVPESPVYLHHHGLQDELRAALESLARRNGKWTEDVQQLVRNIEPHQNRTSEPQRVGLAQLCSATVRFQMALVCSLWVCTAIGSDFWSWITELAKSRQFARHEVEGILVACRICGICGFVSAAACARFFDGMKILACAILVCATTAFIMVALSGAEDAAAAKIALSLLILVFAYDMVWSLLYATTARHFDATCRASALSVASASSRVSAAVAPLVAGSLLERTTSGAFVFWAAGWAGAAVVASALACSIGAGGKAQ